MVEQRDTIGHPARPRGSRRRFLEALGSRATTGRSCASTARCCSVGTELFNHPERPLPLRASSARSSGRCATRAPTSASPRPTSAASRRCSSEQAPRVMATAAAPPDADGWCSLSLHAGGHRRRAPPGRRRPRPAAGRRGLGRAFPAPSGSRPEHPHALHVDEIDVLVESDARPARPRGPAARARSTGRSPSTPAPSSPTGATLQTGIGGDPLDASPRCSPRATAATTASTRRCSPPG